MVPLAAAAFATLFSVATAASDCYNYNGDIVQGWFSCSADEDTVSPCCGGSDYCLSNGLCLDTGGDNYYTQQGCTDPNWGQPCQKYCSSGVGIAGNYSLLWICSAHQNLYCCGADSSCCDETAVTTVISSTTTTATVSLLNIGRFTVASYAPQGGQTTAAVTITKTATVSILTTTGAASTSETATGTGTGTATPANKSSNSRAVKLGVGIGVPVGLVCSAAALAVGFYWGKHMANAANQRQMQSTVAASPNNYYQQVSANPPTANYPLTSTMQLSEADGLTMAKPLTSVQSPQLHEIDS